MDTLASEYGWSPRTIRDLPVKLGFALIDRVIERKNPDGADPAAPDAHAAMKQMREHLLANYDITDWPPGVPNPQRGGDR